ncbi:MAG: NADPH-dependent oxidoreductase [Gammaproteobacteria bacterium]|nr:MAG: NADPH-dependent oxidoreductase [Gammaproteobacteria bacterium]
MFRTAIIYGSSRKDGNTRQVVDLVADKMSADVFDVSDYDISFYDYEHKNRDDDFFPLIETLLKYDCWVFASPVYWYTMSAQLKVFVDRLTDLLDIELEMGRKLAGLNAALITTGAEEFCPTCYEDVFINTFNYLGINYRGCLYVDTRNGVDVAALEKDFPTFLQLVAV